MLYIFSKFSLDNHCLIIGLNSFTIFFVPMFAKLPCLAKYPHFSANFLATSKRKIWFNWTYPPKMFTKLRSEMKETTLGVGQFTTVSCHIFANYIY